jgi:PAS domain S-box-containing protein
MNPDSGEEIIMAIHRDITDQKQAEKRLRESERRHREALEKANLIAIQLDRSGKILFGNTFLCTLTGWEPEEIIGKNWVDFFIPEDIRNTIKKLHREKIIKEKVIEQFENPIMTRKGEIRHISWSNSRTLDEHGKLIGIISLGLDITERKMNRDQGTIFTITFPSDLKRYPVSATG